MNKYYCEINGAPHRFDAYNQVAADEIVEDRAKVMNAAVWTKPVLYTKDINKHDAAFEQLQDWWA